VGSVCCPYLLLVSCWSTSSTKGDWGNSGAREMLSYMLGYACANRGLLHTEAADVRWFGAVHDELRFLGKISQLNDRLSSPIKHILHSLAASIHIGDLANLHTAPSPHDEHGIPPAFLLEYCPNHNLRVLPNTQVCILYRNAWTHWVRCHDRNSMVDERECVRKRKSACFVPPEPPGGSLNP
jgi:hypothetical protein